MFGVERKLDKNTSSFVDFKSNSFTSYQEANDFIDEFSDSNYRINDVASVLPRKDGIWKGQPGNSVWLPDRDEIPKGQHTNPQNKTWGRILDEHKINGIAFKNGEPNFKPIAKAEVKIDDFSTSRSDNYAQADEKAAKQLGLKNGAEVAKYRREKNLTWHECKDQKTMQLLPAIIHGNVSHSGGISEAKKGN